MNIIECNFNNVNELRDLFLKSTNDLDKYLYPNCYKNGDTYMILLKSNFEIVRYTSIGFSLIKVKDTCDKFIKYRVLPDNCDESHFELINHYRKHYEQSTK